MYSEELDSRKIKRDHVSHLNFHPNFNFQMLKPYFFSDPHISFIGGGVPWGWAQGLFTEPFVHGSCSQSPITPGSVSRLEQGSMHRAWKSHPPGRPALQWLGSAAAQSHWWNHTLPVPWRHPEAGHPCRAAACRGTLLEGALDDALRLQHHDPRLGLCDDDGLVSSDHEEHILRGGGPVGGESPRPHLAEPATPPAPLYLPSPPPAPQPSLQMLKS